jgi:hypothetical protein
MIGRSLLILLLATTGWSAQASDVDDYQNSWVHRALSLQRGLDHFQPMSRATFLGTHNSYNSSVWSNATRYVDPNQSRSIYDQLRMDIRAIELDVHTYFSMHGWFWDWGNELLLCHGQDNHLGCSSYDRKFRDGLREVRDWIRRPENANEVLLIYLEDHIDGGWYDDAVDDINDMLGQYIYRPTGGCQGIPMDKSKADIVASGKRILLMTDGCNNGFNDWVFGGVGNDLSGYPTAGVEDLGGYPQCATQRFDRAFQDGHIIRYNEDRTRLSATFSDPGDPITPAALSELLRCGANLPGMDKLTPWDGRLQAAVWSWNTNEPNDYGSGEDCAEHYFSGRFNDNRCDAVRRFACKKPGTRDWYVTGASGTWSEGAAVCQSETGGEYRFSVPTTPLSNEKLKEAKAYHGSAGTVWINYSDRFQEGEWMTGNP